MYRAELVRPEALLLAGRMSYDSGLHGIAQRYFIQTLRMTQAAGDRLLGGSILSAMSHQATFVGRYREAATPARAALTGPAASLTPTLAAQFRAMEARALARLGDPSGCDFALFEAERHLSLRTADSDPAHIAYFDEVELAAEFGHCFRDLGALRASHRARCGLHLRRRPEQPQLLLRDHGAGGGIYQSGRGAPGFEVALSALRLREGLKSARCVQYVREFQERITDGMRRSAEFRTFTDQARGFRLRQQVGTPSWCHSAAGGTALPRGG